jgi:hypothetical protein
MLEKMKKIFSETSFLTSKIISIFSSDFLTSKNASTLDASYSDAHWFTDTPIVIVTCWKKVLTSTRHY